MKFSTAAEYQSYWRSRRRRMWLWTIGYLVAAMVGLLVGAMLPAGSSIAQLTWRLSLLVLAGAVLAPGRYLLDHDRNAVQDYEPDFETIKRKQRSIFWAVVGALIMAMLCGIALAGIATPGSYSQLAAGLLIVVSPVALLFSVVVYATTRLRARRSRTASAQDDPEPADPMHTNRLHNPAPPNLAWYASLAMFGISMLTVALAWRNAALSSGQWAAALAVSAAIGIGTGWATHRASRSGVVAVGDGLDRIAFLRTTHVPWSQVRSLALTEVPARGRYPAGVQIDLICADGVVHTGVRLGTGLKIEEMATRHNIAVVDRWTREHQLPPDPNLDVAAAFVEGRASFEDLVTSVADRSSSNSLHQARSRPKPVGK